MTSGSFQPHATCPHKIECDTIGCCISDVTLASELNYAMLGQAGNALEYQIIHLVCEHPTVIHILWRAIEFYIRHGFD